MITPPDTRARVIPSVDFVIVGLQPWYIRIGSNCKNIAHEISRHNRVLYINSPLDRRTVSRRSTDPDIARHLQIIRDGLDPFEQVAPNLWVYYPQQILESINWLPSTFLFGLVNRLNNRRLAIDIRKATDHLRFSRYVLFNDNELFRALHLKQLLNPLLYIYYCRDYLRSQPYWKKHGDRLEPVHIRRADLALANSGYLHEYLLRYNPRSYDVGQGCDTTLFNAGTLHPIPDDLMHIARPRIGYVGVLTALRLDLSALSAIARHNPEWQLVLVGPEDEAFRQSDLHTLSNVHFSGRKPITELPAYIQHFDVCLNPQLINDLTIGNYPLKIDEYLNMGKPTVATRTRTMEMFRDQVYLADAAEEYPELVEQALQENTAEREQERIRFASGHTWEQSVQRIYDAINAQLTN